MLGTGLFLIALAALVRLGLQLNWGARMFSDDRVRDIPALHSVQADKGLERFWHLARPVLVGMTVIGAVLTIVGLGELVLR